MTTSGPWKVPLIVILVVLSISETNAVTTRRIAVGAEPLNIAVNSVTGLLYSANLDSTLSVADTSTDTVIATISLPSAPLGVAVNEDTNLIYANTSNNGVYVIDGVTNVIIANVATGTGGGQIDT